MPEEQEEDPFEAVRPKYGKQSDQEEDPFASVRPKGFAYEASSKVPQPGNYYLESAKEVATQAPKEITAQALGQYGDILSFLGIEDRGPNKGQRAKFEREFEASPSDLAALSQDEDSIGSFLPPTSQKIREGLETVLPGTPKTPAGRFTKRAANFVGGGAALGSFGLAPNLAAGAAGQTAEELGAPPWVQVTAELGAFLRTAKKPNVYSSDPEVQAEVARLRKMGFDEQDITLAKNALQERGWLKRSGKFTNAAQKKFTQAFDNLEKKTQSLVVDSFPGLEHGTENLAKNAATKFDALNGLAEHVQIDNPKAFVGSANKAIEKLKRTLANTPEEKEVVNILEEAIDLAGKGVPADYFTRFYKGLNRIGKWGNPRERERIFGEMKEAIKETFKDQGPQGKLLAHGLEEANKSWMKFLDASDVVDLFKKASTEEGVNFPKMHRLLLDTDNYQMLKKAVGPETAKNLRQIAKTGMSVKDFEKAIQGGGGKKLIGAAKGYEAIKGFVTLDWRPLATAVGAETAGRIATQFLTNPKLQNWRNGLLQAIKEKKWDVVRTISSKIENEIEESPEGEE